MPRPNKHGWSDRYTNNLPDSAFLYVGSGGSKDSTGRTAPRSLRQFPIRDANGALSLSHLRQSITRLSDAAVPHGKWLMSEARAILNEELKRRSASLGSGGRVVLDVVGIERGPVSPVKESDDGFSIQRFAKSMPLGKYVHPVDEWTLDITPERADLWCKAFGSMRDAGVPVKFTKDHGQGSDSSLGEVVDMWREDDEIIWVVEARGDVAIDMCHRIPHISPEIEGNFKDGKGAVYGEAITAVSITPDPVIPGQRPFVKIAASRVPVLQLSRSMTMNFEKLAELLGYTDAEPLTEDSALELISDALAVKGVKIDELKGLCDEMKGERDALTAKVKELEKGKTLEPDSDVLDDRAEVLDERIESLVDKGAVIPVVAASLKKILCGEVGKRSGYLLSSRVSGTDKPIARKIIDALSENKVVELGAKTGAQAIRAGRTVPGDDKGHDPKVTKEMADSVFPDYGN